jgi:hypothetical protein
MFLRRVPAMLLLAAACSTPVYAVHAQDSMAFLAGDRQTAAQIEHIVETARGQGLPAEPIIAVARHAMLIHAAPARMVAAAQAVARRLALAREALAPSPTPSDIAAGEDALGINGVSADALRAVRAVSPTRPVAVPIGVLAQLVAGGVPSARATATVIDLMRRGATSAQLVALGGDVNADVAAGSRADAALGVRLDGLTPFLARSSSAQTVTAGTQAMSSAGGGSATPRPGGGKKP